MFLLSCLSIISSFYAHVSFTKEFIDKNSELIFICLNSSFDDNLFD